MQWHAANILTVGRLVLVPVFLLCFLVGFYPEALLVFAIASFTDLIDGTVARLLKKHSQMGAFLDPLADKLLMVTTFACLVSSRILPVWFLMLVIIRDTIIMGGVGVLKVLKIEVKYEPFLSSKLTTLSQIVLGLLSLGFLASPNLHFGAYPVEDIILGSTLITTVLVIVTALQYLRKGLEILQGQRS